MSRKEFPKAVKVEVVKRSTRDGVVYCESCKAQAKRWQIDHINPDGLTGQPVLSNAQLLCKPCWEIKNPQDTKDIAKAKRREARSLGIHSKTKPIQSQGFPPAQKQLKASKPLSKPLPERRTDIYGRAI